MRIPPEDQTIGTRAIALLAGEQHASIDVHGAGREGARLSLTWGTLLPGFSAAPSLGPCQRGRRKVGPAKPGTPVPGRRHHHAYLRTVPRAACRVGASSARTPRRGRCGVARACHCQHKTRPVDTAEVSPGPERETLAENGTGSGGAVGHTAGNEGRTP